MANMQHTPIAISMQTPASAPAKNPGSDFVKRVMTSLCGRGHDRDAGSIHYFIVEQFAEKHEVLLGLLDTKISYQINSKQW